MRRWKITIIAGIIAGIMIAIAIPLYTGYVERATVTEAGTSIMITIITSQKVYFTRRAQFYTADNSVDPKAFEPYGVDITDTKFFTYKTAPTPTGGFIVTATPIDAFDEGEGAITCTKNPGAPEVWTVTGTITRDMLLGS